MKKIIFIWIFLFFINLSYAYASHELRHTFDSSDNLSLNANDVIEQNMLHMKEGAITFNAGPGRWILNISRELTIQTTNQNCRNWTLNFQENISVSADSFELFYADNNITTAPNAQPYDSRGGVLPGFKFFDGANNDAQIAKGGHFNNITIFFNCTEDQQRQAYNFYVNGSLIVNHSNRKSATFPDFLIFAREAGPSIWMDNLSACNATSAGKVDIGCVNHAVAPSPPPTFSNLTSNNSAPRLNDIVLFNVRITAGSSALASYIFSWDNGTGVFVNNTPIAFPSGLWIANVTANKTIQNSSGIIINWLWYANDTNGNFINSSSSSLTVAGTTAPNITVNLNNFFSSSNNSFIGFNQSNAVLLNLTFRDDIDLFGVEFNVTNSTGNAIINFTNTSFSGTIFNYTKIINVSGPQDFYNVSITIWDTHTATAINDFKIDDGIGNTLAFDNIKITANNAIYTNTIKDVDRYTFEFDYLPLLTPKTKTFYVESDGSLEYKNNSIYKAHFVDWKNKRWIDFEGIAEKPNITKISDNKWKVEFNNSAQTIIFHSIGGLNFQTNNYIYYLSSPSISWVTPSSDTFISNYSVILNVTGNYQNYTTFYLYNSSLNLISTTNYTSLANNSYFYNNTFTSLTDNLYYINATHYIQGGDQKNSLTITIAKTQLNNCTPAGISAVNYTFKDETNSSLQFGTITGTYNYNVSSVYSISYTLINNYSVCVYPNGSTIPASYTLLYSGTGYPQRQYYDNAAIFNNQTVPIILYMLPSSKGIYARFKIVDSVGTPLASVKGIMSTTALGTLEIETSDAAGIMTFFENPDVTYTFTFSLSGYNTKTLSLRITSGDIYTVTLSKPTTTTTSSYAGGIAYSINPQGTLNNNTNYNFTFNLTSNFWNITDCVFYIENSTTQFNRSSSSFNGSTCNILIIFNTGNLSNFDARVVFQLNATSNQTVRIDYSVKYFYKGTFSLQNAIDDISNFGSSGFSNFGRAILALVITFIIVGGLSMGYSTFREPESLLLVTWGFTFFFAYVGWYSLPSTFPLPTVSIANLTIVSESYLKKYIIFILMTLFTSGYLINRTLT